MDYRRGAACVCEGFEWLLGRAAACCGRLTIVNAFAAYAGSDGALWRLKRPLEVVLQIEFHHVDVTAHMLRCGAGETTFVVGKLNLLELKVQGGAQHIFSAVF